MLLVFALPTVLALNTPQSLDLTTPQAVSSVIDQTRARDMEETAKQPSSTEDDSITAPDDPNDTRLLIGPSARTLSRGEAYLEAVGPLPTVQVGVTDWVTLGVGIVPGLNPANLFVVTPKVRVLAAGRTQAAVGLIHAHVGSEFNVGVAYAAVTQDFRKGAVTVGLGYNYAVEDRELRGLPALLVGGERWVGPRVKLITENYIYRELIIATAGVRIVKNAFSFDVGLAASSASPSTPPFPMFRFAWRFRDGEPRQAATTGQDERDAR